MRKLFFLCAENWVLFLLLFEKFFFYFLMHKKKNVESPQQHNCEVLIKRQQKKLLIFMFADILKRGKENSKTKCFQQSKLMEFTSFLDEAH